MVKINCDLLSVFLPNNGVHFSQREDSMDDTILNKLHDEHQEIKHDIDLMLRTESEPKKRELFLRVKKKLVQHMQGEDLSIYRHFREDIEGGGELTFVKMSDSEHHHIRDFLQRLTLLDIHSQRWDESLKELAGMIKQHVDCEEEEMFFEAREDFSKEELVKIGTEFEVIKSRSS